VVTADSRNVCKSFSSPHSSRIILQKLRHNGVICGAASNIREDWGILYRKDV